RVHAAAPLKRAQASETERAQCSPPRSCGGPVEALGHCLSVRTPDPLRRVHAAAPLKLDARRELVLVGSSPPRSCGGPVEATTSRASPTPSPSLRRVHAAAPLKRPLRGWREACRWGLSAAFMRRPR